MADKKKSTKNPVTKRRRNLNSPSSGGSSEMGFPSSSNVCRDLRHHRNIDQKMVALFLPFQLLSIYICIQL